MPLNAVQKVASRLKEEILSTMKKRGHSLVGSFLLLGEEEGC
jgi:hypothetical protein